VDASGDLFVAAAASELILEFINYGPALSLDEVTAANAGNYDVVVTNPFGSVTSSVATLTVLLPPTINEQPNAQTLPVGGNAEFSVSVAGTAPFAYQWYFGGAVLPGQTNSTLGLTNLNLADGGGYSVVVTNPYGAATSAVAVLTVGFAPVITTQPTNQTIMVGGSVDFTTVIGGTGPFSYQWQWNGTNLPIIITVAGNGTAGYSGDNGSAVNAGLDLTGYVGLLGPTGVAVDGFGNLFVADPGNRRVRRVGTNGVIATVAGNGEQGYSGDGGPATNASMSDPVAVAVDGLGNLFIADYKASVIRKVDVNGLISTVAGNGISGFGGNGSPATNAELAYPEGLAVDAFGNLFETDDSLVRKIDPQGIITTVAGFGYGNGGFRGDGGPATNAWFAGPAGMAVDRLGNLFIADVENQRVRKVDANGIISTVAGGGALNPGDGGAATNAGLSYPADVAVDTRGNLLITEAGGHRVRGVDTNGVITTVAGNGNQGYSGDGGPAANAELDSPSGVAVDGLGNLFILDTGNNRVREVLAYQFGPSFSVSNAAAAKAGNYDVVVTSPFGSVTSSVVTLTVAAPLSLRINGGGGNVMMLQVTGAPGQTYVLESASSLVAPVAWQPVYTNAADASGAWSFTNAAPAAPQVLFYRLAVP
jgi:sugar lactone lactonase YvrE